MKQDSFSVLEKIKFCQYFDGNSGTFCRLSKLLHRLSFILSIAKILKKIGIENLIGCICNKLSVDIVRLDLNIDRKFDYCNHKFIVLKVSAFVLKDSSGVEKDTTRASQSYITGVRELNNYISNVYHSLSIG